MNMPKIAQAVSAAKRDFAWLAAIHIALRSRDAQVQEWAYSLLLYPDLHLRVGGNYSAKEAAGARERGVANLKELCTYVDDKATDVVGAYLNKAAVVYGDAVLEGMFLDIYQAIAGNELNARGVNRQITEIAEKCRKNSIPRSQAADFNGLCYSRWPRFLAQLRNLIVHKMGKVDGDFRAHMGFGGAGTPKKGSPPIKPWEASDEQKATGIWPDERTWDKMYPLGADVCLDIEKVVTPSLVLCARYVEEVRIYFS